MSMVRRSSGKPIQSTGGGVHVDQVIDAFHKLHYHKIDWIKAKKNDEIVYFDAMGTCKECGVEITILGAGATSAILSYKKKDLDYFTYRHGDFYYNSMNRGGKEFNQASFTCERYIPML